MIAPRNFVILSLTCFGVSFSFLIIGIVFHALGAQDTNYLMLGGFPFNFIAILSMWFSSILKAQTERLDRLEAQLLAQTEA